MKLTDFFRTKVTLKKHLIPKHVGLYLRDEPADSAVKTKNIQRLIFAQTKLGIRVVSFYALPAHTNPTHVPQKIDDLIDLVDTLVAWRFLYDLRIKITVLGHWYDLPGRLIEPLKKLQEQTREHDTYFVNLCLNYDGQAEIVDAVSIIARQVKMGRLDLERITKETVNDVISTSTFPAPDLIIKSGPHLSLRGFLLWDAAHSVIFFTKKSNLDFSPQDLLKGMAYYQEIIIKIV
ncbi:undecaprenyl diphosphate synthase family protein [Candidatus Woesearchaeota archaeon]|nr:undecaprenyl diphosphate synthase family protein [Candidatus Woesearchaeota archaeon]